MSYEWTSNSTEGTPIAPAAFGAGKASEDAALTREMAGVVRLLDAVFGRRLSPRPVHKVPEGYISVKQAASAIGVSASTIYRDPARYGAVRGFARWFIPSEQADRKGKGAS